MRFFQFFTERDTAIQAVLGPDSESDSSESDSSVAPGSISPSVVIQREFLCSEQLQGNVKASTETAYNAPLTPNAPSSPPRARTVKPENGVLVTYESGPEDAPTLSTVLIKPPGKVLKDIYTYSSPQRNIRWRNDKNRHSNSHHGQVSIALQALGISQFPPCTCCAAGQGPFEVCVAFRGICDDRIVSKGACANCVWTGHAAICSFREYTYTRIILGEQNPELMVD